MVITGVAVSLVVFFVISDHSSKKLSDTKPIQPLEIVKIEIPVRLKIPKIHVDSFLETVGLTSKGDIAVPKGPTNAAWFNLGPRPGENGAAIIVGHFGWRDNIPAVFDDLNKLQKGDKLYILDEKGATTTFIVSAVRTYGQNEDASGVFSSSDGKAHLNLITCDGVWNKVSKSYSKRLVVFTDNESVNLK